MTTAPTPDEGMPDRLSSMIAHQEKLQREAYGSDLTGPMPDSIRMNLIRTNAFALIAEIIEATDETGWKPWATSNHIRQPAFNGEMVDAWHFFMNLMLLANPGKAPAELAHVLYAGYMAKREKNIERQRAGYDGVSTKCPICGRALDDEGTPCHRDANRLPDVIEPRQLAYLGHPAGTKRTKASGWCGSIPTLYADGAGPGDFRVLDA